MLHNNQITVMADNGVQVFVACDIEEILNMIYDYDYSDGSRKHRYSDREVCDHFDISFDELERIKYTLSYDFNHNADGTSKWN